MCLQNILKPQCNQCTNACRTFFNPIYLIFYSNCVSKILYLVVLYYEWTPKTWQYHSFGYRVKDPSHTTVTISHREWPCCEIKPTGQSPSLIKIPYNGNHILLHIDIQCKVQSGYLLLQASTVELCASRVYVRVCVCARLCACVCVCACVCLWGEGHFK